jgi:hypothetical protein
MKLAPDVPQIPLTQPNARTQNRTESKFGQYEGPDATTLAPALRASFSRRTRGSAAALAVRAVGGGRSVGAPGQRQRRACGGSPQRLVPCRQHGDPTREARGAAGAARSCSAIEPRAGMRRSRKGRPTPGVPQTLPLRTYRLPPSRAGCPVPESATCGSRCGGAPLAGRAKRRDRIENRSWVDRYPAGTSRGSARLPEVGITQGRAMGGGRTGGCPRRLPTVRTHVLAMTMVHSYPPLR